MDLRKKPNYLVSYERNFQIRCPLFIEQILSRDIAPSMGISKPGPLDPG